MPSCGALAIRVPPPWIRPLSPLANTCARSPRVRLGSSGPSLPRGGGSVSSAAARKDRGRRGRAPGDTARMGRKEHLVEREARYPDGSIRESYVFVIDCLERQEVGWLCCKLGEGAMRNQGASCSPYDSALARRSCSHAMASVRAHGPRPKARSTIRASPTMPPWRANIPAWPLRSARITSKPLIVA